MDRGNIVLVGMPGAGKSTIGVLLAKSLGMRFLDTDLAIQEKQGRLLQEIINRDGIERFLQIEEKVILDLEVNNHIIATGGSVIYSNAAVLHLRRRDGKVVYLQLRYDEIEDRLRNITTRGIAMKPGQNLLGLYRERVPLYEKYADITVNCSGLTIEEAVARVVQKMELQKN